MWSEDSTRKWHKQTQRFCCEIPRQQVHHALKRVTIPSLQLLCKLRRAYQRHAGPGVGHGPRELREGGRYLNHPVYPDLNSFGLYNELLLESGATHTTMCNLQLLEQIDYAERWLDMSRNMGSRLIEEECVLGEYPPIVYFDEGGKANVMSRSKMRSHGYHITVDSDVENAFNIHSQIMRFVESKGIYLWEDPEHSMNETNTSLAARQVRTNNQPVFFFQRGSTQMMETSMPTVRSINDIFWVSYYHGFRCRKCFYRIL